MKVETYNLIAFLSTLAAIIALSKIGGSGADLAIMTALVAVLGGLTQNFRKASPVSSMDSGDINIEKDPQK